MRLLHRDHTNDDTREHVDTDDADTHATSDDTRMAVATPTHTERTVVTDHDRDHLDRDDTTPAVIRERMWTFAPGQLISLIAGAALVAVGALALARAGVSRPLDQPVTQVLGWDHTAWLGIAEVGLGGALMLVGTGAWGRPLSILLGAATVVAGVLVLADPGAMPSELAVEEGFGWPLVALGAIVALAAMALPVWRTNHTNVKTVDLRTDDRRESRHFWSRH